MKRDWVRFVPGLVAILDNIDGKAWRLSAYANEELDDTITFQEPDEHRGQERDGNAAVVEVYSPEENPRSNGLLDPVLSRACITIVRDYHPQSVAVHVCGPYAEVVHGHLAAHEEHVADGANPDQRPPELPLFADRCVCAPVSVKALY